MGEGAERNDAPAGLVVGDFLRLIPVLDLAPPDGLALVDLLRLLVVPLLLRAETAGGREAEDRDTCEQEAEDGAGRAAGQTRNGLRPGEDRIADHAAETRRQGPALGRREGTGERRRGARADHPEGKAQLQAAEIARFHEPPAPERQGQHGRDGAEPQELHQQVGHDGAGPAEEIADGKIGGVVEARIVDRPGGERHRHRTGDGDQAQARQLLRPAGQESPKGAEEAIIGGRRTAGRTHQTTLKIHRTGQCC